MKKIPEVSNTLKEQLNRDVLEANNKLLSDIEISRVMEVAKHINLQEGQQDAYISKKKLKQYGASANASKYSIYKHGEEFYAVYPGKVTTPEGKVVQTVLGRGQYGAARLVQNLTTGEWGVLKTQQIDLSTSAKRQTEAKISIRMGLAMSHVETTSTKDNKGRHKMLMRYVPGVELKDFLNTHGGYNFDNNSYDYPEQKHSFGKIGYEERLTLALAILDKLAELEKHSISHSDPHTGNIKYFRSENGGTGDVELLDFGESVDLKARQERDETALAANPTNRDLQRNLEFAKHVLPYKDSQVILKKVIAPLLGIGEQTMNSLGRANIAISSIITHDCCFIEDGELPESTILASFRTLLEQSKESGQLKVTSAAIRETIQELLTVLKANQINKRATEELHKAAGLPQSGLTSAELRRSASRGSTPDALSESGSPSSRTRPSLSPGRRKKDKQLPAEALASPTASDASISPATNDKKLPKQKSILKTSPAVSNQSISPDSVDSTLSNQSAKFKQKNSSSVFFKEPISSNEPSPTQNNNQVPSTSPKN